MATGIACCVGIVTTEDVDLSTDRALSLEEEEEDRGAYLTDLSLCQRRQDQDYGYKCEG